MRIAVIGGAGYIGAHVLLALEQTAHDVLVFDNFTNGNKRNIQASYIEGDIRNQDQVDSFFEDFKPDVVIHLAALKAAGASMEDVTAYADVNITGTINILNSMVKHKVNSLVFSSSAAVYGDPPYNPVDESCPTCPTNFYGYTKLAAEQLFPWYDEVHGIKTIALRYFNAAGYDERIAEPEREPENLLPILLEAVMGTRAEVKIFGDDYPTPDGSCIRDYISVVDLADAHLKAIEYVVKHQCSDTLNLGTGAGISVKECVAAAQLLRPFTVRIAPRRVGDPAEYYTDATKAQRLLEWTPLHSDLQELLRSMYMVYQKK